MPSAALAVAMDDFFRRTLVLVLNCPAQAATGCLTHLCIPLHPQDSDSTEPAYDNTPFGLARGRATNPANRATVAWCTSKVLAIAQQLSPGAMCLSASGLRMVGQFRLLLPNRVTRH
jgi:hypothetical protein